MHSHRRANDKGPRSWFKSGLELLSIIAPIICLVDCVVIPICLAVLPMMGLHHVMHGIGDQVLSLLVLSICCPVIIPGFLEHRRKRVLVLMGLGFACIFMANFMSHILDDTIHFILSVIGSSCLIKANFDNKNLRKCGCGHKH